MSLNLFMKGTNPDTGEIENINLYQTPTEITKELLNSGNQESILNAYLEWVRDNFFDTSHIDSRTRNPYLYNEITIINNEFEEYEERLRSYENIKFSMG